MGTPSGLDLSQFDTKSASEAGTEVHLDNPFTGEKLFTDDGTPMTITIMGDDSGKVRAFARQTWDVKAEKVKKGRDYDMSYDITEAETARKLALATIRWQGITLDGESLDCTEANAYRLYMDSRLPWLREQLSKAIGDRQRFFKKTSGS